MLKSDKLNPQLKHLRRRIHARRKEKENLMNKKVLDLVNSSTGSSQAANIKKLLTSKLKSTSCTFDDVESLRKGFQDRFSPISKDVFPYFFREYNVNDDTFPFSPAKVKNVLLKMNSNKAIGFDECSLKLLKPLAAELGIVLSDFFGLIFRFGIIPCSWRLFRTVLLRKNGNGNSASCEDYRPIALGSHLRKIYEILILHEVKPKLDIDSIFLRIEYLK
jgi:hypothetical protein